MKAYTFREDEWVVLMLYIFNRLSLYQFTLSLWTDNRKGITCCSVAMITRQEHIDRKDILQIITGSLAPAIVFAPTTELRTISQTIPAYKVIIIMIITIIFSAFLAYLIGGEET